MVPKKTSKKSRKDFPDKQGTLFEAGSEDGRSLVKSVIRTETVISKLPCHVLSKQAKNPVVRIMRRQANGEVNLLWDLSFNARYGPPRQIAYAIDTLVVNRRIDELPRPLPKYIRLGSMTEL